MFQPVMIPTPAPLGASLSEGAALRRGPSQVLITVDADSTMVLSQRTAHPAMFGTLADLWDLQVADAFGEWDEGIFVTAFRQGDLMILRQVNGDKRITIDFSAEHAYVDHGDGAVQSFDEIEMLDDEVPASLASFRGTAWDGAGWGSGWVGSMRMPSPFLA